MKYVLLAAEDLPGVTIGKLLIDSISSIKLLKALPPTGQGRLKRRITSYIEMAQHSPVIVLTDLDSSPCPTTLIQSWLGNTPKPQNLVFRVCVQEVESWIMADALSFSKWSHIPKTKIPNHPDKLNSPKEQFLTLVRRHSPKDLKNQLLPLKGSSSKVGPEYNTAIERYLNSQWNLSRAIVNSPSLNRAYLAVQKLAKAS